MCLFLPKILGFPFVVKFCSSHAFWSKWTVVKLDGPKTFEAAIWWSERSRNLNFWDERSPRKSSIVFKSTVKVDGRQNQILSRGIKVQLLIWKYKSSILMRMTCRITKFIFSWLLTCAIINSDTTQSNYFKSIGDLNNATTIPKAHSQSSKPRGICIWTYWK